MSIGRDRRCQSNTAMSYREWCEEYQASYCLSMLEIKDKKQAMQESSVPDTTISNTLLNWSVVGAPVTIAALLLDLRSKNVWHGLGGVA